MSKRIKEVLEESESCRAVFYDHCIIKLKNGHEADVFNVNLDKNGLITYDISEEERPGIESIEEKDLSDGAIKKIEQALDEEQVGFFDESGYLICANVVE